MVDISVDKLSKTKCKRLGDGKHSDGRGLYFFVRGTSKTWSLRYTEPDGRRRERSLGVYPEVSLEMARQLRDGTRHKKTARSHMLRSWVGRWLKANRHDRKDAGRSGRWLSPLRVHVLPKLGQMDVRDLTFDQIKDAFTPIWRTKTSVAAKGLDRLGMVMR